MDKQPEFDPDAIERPEPYTETEWAETEGSLENRVVVRQLDVLPEETWVGESGTVYDYDPREGYDLGDPKRDGPGGYW